MSVLDGMSRLARIGAFSAGNAIYGRQAQCLKTGNFIFWKSREIVVPFARVEISKCIRDLIELRQYLLLINCAFQNHAPCLLPRVAPRTAQVSAASIQLVEAGKSWPPGTDLDAHRIPLAVEFDLCIFTWAGTLHTAFGPRDPAVTHPKAPDVARLNPSCDRAHCWLLEATCA
jgi:hypothetical protein